MHQQLADLAEEYWDFQLRTGPTEALMLGDHRYDDQIEDLSRQAEDVKIAALDRLAAEAAAIDSESLTEDELVTRAVLEFDASTRAGELRQRFAEFDVDPQSGVQIVYLQLAPQFPIVEPEHGEAMVGKWSQLGGLFDDAIHRLRQGLAGDRTPPRVAVERVLSQVDAYLATPIADDPLVNLRSPEAWSEDEVASWRERLATQIRDVVRPGYERYRTCLADEVMARARPPERTGLAWIAGGEAAYAAAIARHTSLDLTPTGIHDVGRDEIAALEAEYAAAGAGVLGTGDVQEIYGRLRDDSALRFETGPEIVAAAQAAMDRARDAVPDWFGRLPKADCVMDEIPEIAAKDSPIAYYLQPAEDGSRPGTYYVNTTEPTTRTRYEAEALAFHESIPGHHLQLAIAIELEDVPSFRRHGFLTVFHEGWGLYTERLADEMGLYSGPLERLGMASFDAWRACRLVVDTGMHALGWSRQEAIDYMVANSPQAPNNIVNEIDRYIAWPGQALAYKIGQRAMRKARAEAEEAMGAAFDIKAFHDVLLGAGPVPIGVMQDRVRAWATA
jgi:uncharacterized protein (DUF885 family)